MENKIGKSLPRDTAHHLSLEAARTLLAMHEGDKKLTPTQVAIKLWDYYDDAWNVLSSPRKHDTEPPT